MFNTLNSPHNKMADQAASSADHAIKSTQRVANEALEGLAGGVEDMRQKAIRVGDQASTLAHRGVDAVRESSQHLRDRAVRASDDTVDYIRHEPVKSILIAAAAGAAVMVLLGLLGRSHTRR